MFKNYLLIAARQLLRNKFYSAINILGMAICMASCFLIVVYVVDELSYDQFHKNKDRIYRIAETFKTGDGLVTTGLTPYKLGPYLTIDFVKLVILANLFAWPIAFFIMKNWLQSFPYRIEVGIGTFVASALIALVIAICTVSSQAIQASLANPVKSLRSE